MKESDRDYALDTLLDLHGQTLLVDEFGHWVKFFVGCNAAATRINPMKTLITGIAAYESMKARTMAIARGKHKPAKDEPTVWFTSVESFAKVLSQHNRELLTLIAREKPSSLTELATLAGRKTSNLSRTLKTMALYGLVELTPGERGKLIPRVTFDQVRLDVSLTSAPALVGDSSQRQADFPQSRTGKA